MAHSQCDLIVKLTNKKEIQQMKNLKNILEFTSHIFTIVGVIDLIVTLNFWMTDFIITNTQTVPIIFF